MPKSPSDAKRRAAARVELAKLPPPLPTQWVTVSRLAAATGETQGKIYAALYDPDRPMPCARQGRAIRVRLADWLSYWDQRQQLVVVREPARGRGSRAILAELEREATVPPASDPDE